MKKIGIVDTTFARFDMGKSAINELQSSRTGFKIVRYTVPGIKDLPVGCKKMFDEQNCDICMALGMPGPKPIDKQCAHEASIGLIQTQLLCNKHIIEVFVHLDEAKTDRELIDITKNRVAEHVKNALAILFDQKKLISLAGYGKRQGFSDVGPVIVEE